jgi:nitrogen fixation NifU-like protein
MTEAVKGKTIDQAKELFEHFHTLVTKGLTDEIEILGKLSVLGGVVEYPARVKCATLAWHTLVGALNNETETVSTE